jgi:hypothetical protein
MTPFTLQPAWRRQNLVADILAERKWFFPKDRNKITVQKFSKLLVIRRIPRPVYELEDLNQTPIDGQFYAEELTPVRISKRTAYKIDKILERSQESHC